jgi:hypothetical protein
MAVWRRTITRSTCVGTNGPMIMATASVTGADRHAP